MIFRALFRRCYTNSVKLIYRRYVSDVNSFTWRTHTCGDLRDENIGQEVILCGWISYYRYQKFIIIKDAYGSTQIIFDEHDIFNKNFAFSLPLESVIQVKGIARSRPPNKTNRDMPTGKIEVLAKEVTILNESMKKLPFTSRAYQKVLEATKQKYRYLSLRMTKEQDILRTRSQFVIKLRDFLCSLHGFIEVETPTLFKRTPGGAKEFIVPTKFPGRAYSLVQSPQQFKQMLMVGAIDRYFQIARCYRNEGTKSDRQPEFTQVDIEASFTTAKDIRRLVENMLQHSWPEGKHKLNVPFPIITYQEAMSSYGTDKPDLRYEMKIHDITHILDKQNIAIFNQAVTDSGDCISAITVPMGSKHIKKSHLKEFEAKAQQYSLPNILDIQIKADCKWSSFLSKHIPGELQKKVNEVLKAKENDMILLSAGKKENVQQLLGKIRIDCADIMNSLNVEIYKPNDLSFVWVIDFPLFLKNEDGNVESTHHPFTAPYIEHVDRIYTDPLKAQGQHYDLVLNGQEVGGGSIRIHNPDLQKYVLEDVLKEDSSEMQHLLDALASGCPPHGGIALGIDRLVAIMFNCHSISEVIAFPKSLDGKDLLSGAPSTISEDDKLIYHIETKIPDRE